MLDSYAQLRAAEDALTDLDPHPAIEDALEEIERRLVVVCAELHRQDVAVYRRQLQEQRETDAMPWDDDLEAAAEMFAVRGEVNDAPIQHHSV
jgi:hypothetical protein